MKEDDITITMIIFLIPIFFVIFLVVAFGEGQKDMVNEICDNLPDKDCQREECKYKYYITELNREDLITCKVIREKRWNE
jgi:hypothetical protein